jgi:hypothetical protein
MDQTQQPTLSKNIDKGPDKKPKQPKVKKVGYFPDQC